MRFERELGTAKLLSRDKLCGSICGTLHELFVVVDKQRLAVVQWPGAVPSELGLRLRRTVLQTESFYRRVQASESNVVSRWSERTSGRGCSRG